MFLNVQGLIHNFDEVISQIAIEKRPRIMTFVETHITRDICPQEIEIESYNVIRCDTTNSRTGEIVIYINEGINVTEIINMEVDRNVWMIIVKICENGNGELILCAAYHSPSTSGAMLVEIMRDVGEMLMQYDRVIIMGDFNLNINANRREYYAEKLLNILESCGFK